MPEHIRKVALVTGTSSGIGAATARELLRRGWLVAGVSRRPLNAKHPNYRHLALDLSRVSDLVSGIEAELDTVVSDPLLERIAVVNCAADPGLLGTVEQTDAIAMLRVYAINVVAPANLMAWLVAGVRTGAAKLIVNLSSGVTEGAYPGMSTYGGTKVALRMTGQVLAEELNISRRHPDVSILSYDPGPVDTPMQTLVRTTPVETLPIVEVFEQFAEQGMLSQSEDHAKEIADYLESDDRPRYAEKRFSGAPDPARE